VAVTNDAHIWAVMAASGQGKGVWIKRQLQAIKPARLVVWDFMGEYGEHAKPVPSLAALHKAMAKAGADGPARLAYTPRATEEKPLRREFEAACELVYAWGGCMFIAEELANVTTPGWAPAAWRKMSTSGRHQGLHLIGVSQRPALIDKTFLGNATLIHAGPLRYEADRNAVGAAMDIDPGRLAPLVKFQWLEKDFETGQVSTGYTYPKGMGKRDTAGPA